MKYDDIVLDKEVIKKSKITKWHVLVYRIVTQDHNPIHFNKKYCAKTKFKKPIVPGFLLFSAIPKIKGVLIKSMKFNFYRPAYVDEELICICKAIKKKDKKVTFFGCFQNNKNQKLIDFEFILRFK